MVSVRAGAEDTEWEPLSEGGRIADAADGLGLPLRLTGGVGVALRCPSAARAPLKREYADVDVVGIGRDRRAIAELLVELGYESDEGFNAINGATRLLFRHGRTGRQVDVFLDRVELCHRIDLRGRVAVDRLTLPLADLLLMKLQVVETNQKDLLDIAALLVDHDFTPDDGGINLPYLAGLAGGDWGIWRTMTLVAHRAEEYYSGQEEELIREGVARQVRALLEGLEMTPKSRRWKLRALVGERVRWYEVPEDT
jgi:hypothetical protein